VVDLEKGKVILEIAGSKPKGAAPDKITDGVKAADFEVKVEAGPLGYGQEAEHQRLTEAK
jgi:hypothetical protein